MKLIHEPRLGDIANVDHLGYSDEALALAIHLLELPNPTAKLVSETWETH